MKFVLETSENPIQNATRILIGFPKGFFHKGTCSEKSGKKETGLLEAADRELIEIARKDKPSVFRNRSYGGMCEDNWMDEVRKELLTLPAVASILSTLLDCSMEKPEKCLLPLCLLYGVIMFIRCHHLSRIQRINTVLITEGKASANVSYFEILQQL